MANRILVTYASRAGSTAEVAEAIARTLQQDGAQVDVAPMSSAPDLSQYESVVVGSAVRGARWLPEAVEFVRAQQSTLAHKKVALFTVCITMAMKNAENYRAGVMNWIAPVRAMVQPIREELFAGMLDFSKLPLNKDTLMLRLTVALGIFPRGDHRDWTKIEAWAHSLKPVLL